MSTENSILIRLSEVIELVGLSKSSIYRRLNPKDKKFYDSTFPRPIKIGNTSNRWVKQEVEEWINNLILQRKPS